MELRPLHPLLADKATLTLTESPEKMQESLRVIKEWISEQPHLNARVDDQFLAAFIRGNKFKLEMVKKKIDLFYTCRKAAPEFYRMNHRHDVFREILNTGFYIILPSVSDPASPRVTIIRPGVHDSAKHSITDVLSANHILDKILLVDDDNSIVAGNITVIDLIGSNILRVLIQLPPHTLKKVLVCLMDCMPFRTTYTFIINTPPGFDSFLKIMINFLNDKEKQEIKAYSDDFEELYNHVPRDILPEEYGGNAGNLSDIIDYWRVKLEQYSEWLDEDLQYGTDEIRRPGGPKTGDSMFGEGGSADMSFFLNICRRLSQDSI